MPQNWWEMYPEIVPSPAARPRPMPMLGDAMSGPAMGLQAGQPYSAFGPDPFSSGRFGPSDFTGGQPGIGQLQSRIPDQAGRFGYPEAPQVSDPIGSPLDRRAAVQQAAAAIRGGADPRAVRARLNQVGFGGADLALQDPFSDLVPGGRQGAMDSGMTGQIGMAPQEFGSGLVRSQSEPVQDPSASAFTKQMPIASANGKLTGGRKSFSTAATFQPDDPPEDPFTDMMAADERGVAQTQHPRPPGGRRDPYSEANLTLGPNEQYRADILAAARFYHLTPQGVAATVGTEMLPGRWNPNADNGVAVGLSQFKAETWIGEAQRRGSFLNRVASQLGYLDSHGRMIPARRQQFLAVRNNPEASIWAAADYAAYNLNVLRREGYILNESPAALARYAYIAHHEGLAGARRFLRGDVNVNELQFLQNIQRPADRARYLAANGNDRNRAYRDFHANLIDGRVDVTQYMANRDGVEVPPTRSLFR